MKADSEGKRREEKKRKERFLATLEMTEPGKAR